MMNDLVKFPLDLNLKKGEEKMIQFEDWLKVKNLFSAGYSKRKISKELGICRKTVRKILQQEKPVPYRREKERKSKIDRFKEFILKRAPEVDYMATRIYEEIKELGYEGGYDLVKIFLRPLKEEKEALVRAELRFETPFIYAGKHVEVERGDDGRILIFYRGSLISSHREKEGRYQSSVQREHFRGLLQNEKRKDPSFPQYDLSYWRDEELGVERRELLVYERISQGGENV